MAKEVFSQRERENVEAEECGLFKLKAQTLFLPIIAYTLSTTKLEIRAK
jgi:hypothetical protein